MDFKKTIGGVTHKLSIDPSGIDICGNGHVNINTDTSKIHINCNHIDIDASSSIVGSFDLCYNDVYLDISKNLLQEGINIGGIIPLHGVIMWSGSQLEIPEGWALCDGGNVLSDGVTMATPDMTGQFLIGGDDNTVNTLQGNANYYINNANMPQHQHPFGPINTASSNANHYHGTTLSSWSIGNRSNDVHHHTYDSQPQSMQYMSNWLTYNHANHPTHFRYGNTSGFTSGTANAYHSHNFSRPGKYTGSQSHSHYHPGTSGSTSQTGGGTPIKNTPSFYVLAFIIKI